MTSNTTRNLRAASLWGLIVLAFSLVPVLSTSSYHTNLACQILIWSLFAVSFNMLWGITGMLSLGQALYYGLGGRIQLRDSQDSRGRGHDDQDDDHDDGDDEHGFVAQMGQGLQEGRGVR